MGNKSNNSNEPTIAANNAKLDSIAAILDAMAIIIIKSLVTATPVAKSLGPRPKPPDQKPNIAFVPMEAAI